ncbi:MULTISPECIES: hypothetical protein [unclassified Pseudonocardia]|uniref:hypothetical protein n=1 Tax=unclassified Pseudonocardia TaxID=2619320 RepID=UPI0002E205C8|nr:hypothetical protein [Pseudonocardia sp. Ae707_Ps1]
MNTDRTPASGSRRRALLILGGAAVLVVALLVGVVVSLASMFGADEPSSTYQRPPSSTGADDAGGTGSGTGPEAEAGLARAPMLEVPDQAALPHTLSTRSAGAPITLPQPEQVSGVLVPTGFPDTEQGAIAQAVELTRVGFAGADPQVWAQAYNSIAEPGAAPAAQTPASQDLVAFRRAANMPRTGATRATVTWTPTSALVKGKTDDGNYVVTCVLGELVTDYKGRVATGGLGNCLPMRRVGDQWLVASGPRAWVAPATWPGSDEAVSVGYRDIIR